MNFADLRFVVISIGAGVGLGAALAAKHGFLGFIIGFVIAVAAMMLLLGLVRVISRR